MGTYIASIQAGFLFPSVASNRMWLLKMQESSVTMKERVRNAQACLAAVIRTLNQILQLLFPCSYCVAKITARYKPL